MKDFENSTVELLLPEITKKQREKGEIIESNLREKWRRRRRDRERRGCIQFIQE
jgi:hypothetical protein